MLDAFVHIPKTAGSSLKYALGHLYPEGAIETEDFPLEPWSDLYEKYRHVALQRMRLKAALDTISRMSPAEQKQLRLISGHFRYGIHRHLRVPCRYFTMLRHPVERTLSFYFYFVKGSHTDIGLEAFSLIEQQLDNGMVRQLAGIEEPWKEDCIAVGKVDDAIYQMALANLEEFAVVGLSEEFDRSMMLMRRVMGWHIPPIYAKTRVTDKRPSAEEVSRAAIDAILHRNQQDLKLWEYAKERLSRELAMHPDLDDDVERLRRANRVYSEEGYEKALAAF